MSHREASPPPNFLPFVILVNKHKDGDFINHFVYLVMQIKLIILITLLFSHLMQWNKAASLSWWYMCLYITLLLQPLSLFPALQAFLTFVGTSHNAKQTTPTVWRKYATFIRYRLLLGRETSTQALPNQRQQLKPEWSLVSARSSR
jgi:hypothetical protein